MAKIPFCGKVVYDPYHDGYNVYDENKTDFLCDILALFARKWVKITIEFL